MIISRRKAMKWLAGPAWKGRLDGVVNVYRPFPGSKTGKTPNIGEPKEGRKT
jgi:hypothetical protein